MRKKFLPIGIALVLALLFGGYWYLDYFNTNTSLSTGQKVRFTVTEGMTTSDIATMLHDKKLIQTPESFQTRTIHGGLPASNASTLGDAWEDYNRNPSGWQPG